MHKPTAAETVVPAEVIARRAVQAAYFGFFVDMFEVYLPIAVLAPALVYFIPPAFAGQRKLPLLFGLCDLANWATTRCRDLWTLWRSGGPPPNNTDLSCRLRHCRPWLRRSPATRAGAKALLRR